MRSIARRIESGPARGRERSGTSKRHGKGTGRRKREGDTTRMSEERDRTKEREGERRIARKRERSSGEETWRDEEAVVSFLHARAEEREEEREEQKERRDEIEKEEGISSTVEERRRARTAVVNGNNCYGRCHSKARECLMPDVRRWLESLRSSLGTAIHTLCTMAARRRQRCNGVVLASARLHATTPWSLQAA